MGKPQQRNNRPHPSTALYVGNLPDGCTPPELRTLFSEAAPVKDVHIVKDKDFGFVHFIDVDQASTALKLMRDRAFRGKLLNVNFAKSSPKSGPPPGKESLAGQNGSIENGAEPETGSTPGSHLETSILGPPPSYVLPLLAQHSNGGPGIIVRPPPQNVTRPPPIRHALAMRHKGPPPRQCLPSPRHALRPRLVLPPPRHSLLPPRHALPIRHAIPPQKSLPPPRHALTLQHALPPPHAIPPPQHSSQLTASPTPQKKLEPGSGRPQFPPPGSSGQLCSPRPSTGGGLLPNPFSLENSSDSGNPQPIPIPPSNSSKTRPPDHRSAKLSSEVSSLSASHPESSHALEGKQSLTPDIREVSQNSSAPDSFPSQTSIEPIQVFCVNCKTVGHWGAFCPEKETAKLEESRSEESEVGGSAREFRGRQRIDHSAGEINLSRRGSAVRAPLESDYHRPLETSIHEGKRSKQAVESRCTNHHDHEDRVRLNNLEKERHQHPTQQFEHKDRPHEQHYLKREEHLSSVSHHQSSQKPQQLQQHHSSRPTSKRDFRHEINSVLSAAKHQEAKSAVTKNRASEETGTKRVEEHRRRLPKSRPQTSPSNRDDGGSPHFVSRDHPAYTRTGPQSADQSSHRANDVDRARNDSSVLPDPNHHQEEHRSYPASHSSSRKPNEPAMSSSDQPYRPSPREIYNRALREKEMSRERDLYAERQSDSRPASSHSTHRDDREYSSQKKTATISPARDHHRKIEDDRRHQGDDHEHQTRVFDVAALTKSDPYPTYSNSTPPAVVDKEFRKTHRSDAIYSNEDKADQGLPYQRRTPIPQSKPEEVPHYPPHDIHERHPTRQPRDASKQLSSGSSAEQTLFPEGRSSRPQEHRHLPPSNGDFMPPRGHTEASRQSVSSSWQTILSFRQPITSSLEPMASSRQPGETPTFSRQPVEPYRQPIVSTHHSVESSRKPDGFSRRPDDHLSRDSGSGELKRPRGESYGPKKPANSPPHHNGKHSKPRTNNLPSPAPPTSREQLRRSPPPRHRSAQLGPPPPKTARFVETKQQVPAVDGSREKLAVEKTDHKKLTVPSCDASCDKKTPKPTPPLDPLDSSDPYAWADPFIGLE